MDEENRRDTVADALRPILEEGEAYNVFCHEGEVHVQETDTSVCAVQNPRLYGRLLSLNTQLDNAGGGIGRLPMLAALTFCVGLHLGWWEDWLGPVLNARLDHVLFYLLVAYVLFQLLSLIWGTLQKRLYRECRDELYLLIAREGLDRDRLLALIEGDPAVARVSHFLKLDTEDGDHHARDHSPAP